MPDLLNGFPRISQSFQCVQGRVTFATGTPSLASLTGYSISDQAQVSLVDTGTGLVTITVNNFLGEAGVCVGRGTAEAQDTLVAVSNGTYSGNAASVLFNITTAGTLTDVNFNFEIWAY